MIKTQKLDHVAELSKLWLIFKVHSAVDTWTFEKYIVPGTYRLKTLSKDIW